jgi:hypothetical protein
MKKIVIVLLLTTAAYSQNVPKKELVNKYLPGAWKANYAMLNGLKVEKMAEMKSLEYTFKLDGTFSGAKDVKGTWKYNSKQKSIGLYQNGALKSTISSLQSKKMIMILNIGDAAPKGVQSLEIHLKPKV